MDMHHDFEFRRAIDGLVYRFQRIPGESESCRYSRADGAVHVEFSDAAGWVARDPATGEITGLPWCVPVDQQTLSHPPEGVWVSRKGDQSYVYELIFVAPAG